MGWNQFIRGFSSSVLEWYLPNSVPSSSSGDVNGSSGANGSGAKYQGRNETYWEHQSEASITWGYGAP